MRQLYEEKGSASGADVTPIATIRPHRQLRNLFDKAFNATRIKQIDPMVEKLSYRLIVWVY